MLIFGGWADLVGCAGSQGMPEAREPSLWAYHVGSSGWSGLAGCTHKTLSAQQQSEPSHRALKYDTASAAIILLFTQIVVNGSTSFPSLVYMTIQGLWNGTGEVKTESMICLRKASLID